MAVQNLSIVTQLMLKEEIIGESKFKLLNNIMTAKFFILLTFLFSTGSLFAQTFSLSGNITDTEKVKLSYVNISLLTADSLFIKGTVSDNLGYYKLSKVEKGNYLLRVSSIGFKTQYTSLLTENNTEQNILLQKQETELDAVNIEAEKQLYKIEADKRVYLVANDESMQASFADNALENAPGVFISIDGLPEVRGEVSEIWIDGKPSRKTPEQTSQYLQSLPAARIERIEVMTNPSARYTATNTNSIINIVLKKKIFEDRLLAAGVLYNPTGIVGSWLTFYITKKKFDFNIYGYGSMYYLPTTRMLTDINKSYLLSNIDTTFVSDFNKNTRRDRIGGKIVSDFTYRLSEKTKIYGGVFFDRTNSLESIKTDLSVRFKDPIKSSSQSVLDENWLITNGNLRVDKTINTKQSVDFSVYYNRFAISSVYDFEKYNYNEIVEIRHSSPSIVYTTLNINGNYKLKLGDGKKLQTGFTLTPINSDENRNLIDTSSFKGKLKRQNDILSKEFKSNISFYEFYTNLSGILFNINYKLGLRYEYSVFDLKQTIPSYKLIRTFKNLYPSVHLSYETESKHNFSFSYSRRVNTPVYKLNPYIDRTDDSYISAGNPNLKLASTNSYEINYLKQIKENINISASIYGKYTKNDITSINEPIFDDYFEKTVILSSFANCATTKRTGSELSISANPLKLFRIRLYANTQYKTLAGNYKEQEFNLSGYNTQINLKLSYNFFDIFNFSLVPVYKSDSQGFFQNKRGSYFVNTGLKFDLLDKKISFNIKGRDIFNTRKRLNEYYYNDYYQYSEQVYTTQMVQFIAIYRFGNPKLDRKAKVNQLSR